MKKFLYKVTCFLLPVLCLCIFTWLCYVVNKGDLLRIGYIKDVPEYRKVFGKELSRPRVYKRLTDIDFNVQQHFDVLTIGDSFSEQQGFSYINYLADNPSLSIVHYNGDLHDNAIQELYSLCNGDFFDKVQVRYVVLQCVERELLNISEGIDANAQLLTKTLLHKIAARKSNVEQDDETDALFTDRNVIFPLYNVLYYFNDHAFYSDTYKVATDLKLFSVERKELLFFGEDLRNASKNNKPGAATTVNLALERLSAKLSQKNVTLIVLPSPDKYDFYFDNILEKDRYIKPEILDRIGALPKSYQYVDSRRVLRGAGGKDIYFYDDTHWSPWASQRIAVDLAHRIFPINLSN